MPFLFFSKLLLVINRLFESFRNLQPVYTGFTADNPVGIPCSILWDSKCMVQQKGEYPRLSCRVSQYDHLCLYKR